MWGPPSLGPASGLSGWRRPVPPPTGLGPFTPVWLRQPAPRQPSLRATFPAVLPSALPKHREPCHLHPAQKSTGMRTLYPTKADARGSGTSPGSALAPKLTSLTCPPANTEPSPAGLLPEPQSRHAPTSESGGCSSSGWTVLRLRPSFLTHKHPCSAKASTPHRRRAPLQSTTREEYTAARESHTSEDEAKTQRRKEKQTKM